MAINHFNSTVWSKRIQGTLEKASVFMGVINRDYEGEVRLNASVKINSIGAVTVGDYTKNGSISAPETLTSAQVELTINQAKFFNFEVDDIDAATGAEGVLDQGMIDAAYRLRDTFDALVAAEYANAASANLIGTTGSPKTDLDADKAYTYLVDLGVLLDEQNVPAEGRWVVVPSWYHALLLKNDAFIATGGTGAESTLASGVVGQAAGFTVMKSNNVANTSGTKYRVMAGHRIAISAADAIASVEAFRPEASFSDAVKGLHVYGIKTVRPEALAVLTCNKPA